MKNQSSDFSKADFESIPALEKALLDKKPGMNEVMELKQEKMDPAEYLEWLIDRVAQSVYDVAPVSGSPGRERGAGRRKIGAHSEGKHR